jgi:hypothetical protein
MRARQLVQGFKAEFAEPLRKADYLLADTRIPWVSLYDHLVLTGGIAAAFAEELLRRGRTAEEICGLSLDPSELRHLACLCGLLHDLGKAREGETEYRLHVQRGVEYATEWLTAKGVDGRLHEIIVGSVARHHLRDGPQTLFEKLVCLADSYASAGDRPELGRASSLEEFLRTIRETEALERELFEGQPPLCLLMGDTDAIKGYVYETQALPEIRGASQILVELEDEVRKLFRSELVEECLIYYGTKPIVPATTLKGWLREAAERILRGFGLNICDSSRADTVCSACPVCEVFGAPRLRSPIRFADAILEDPATDVRMNVSLSRHRRTAYEERLFSTEVAWHSRMRARIEGWLDSQERALQAAALLLLAAKAGYAIGAARSRGLGWIRLSSGL